MGWRSWIGRPATVATWGICRMNSPASWRPRRTRQRQTRRCAQGTRLFRCCGRLEECPGGRAKRPEDAYQVARHSDRVQSPFHQDDLFHPSLLSRSGAEPSQRKTRGGEGENWRFCRSRNAPPEKLAMAQESVKVLTNAVAFLDQRLDQLARTIATSASPRGRAEN